MLLVQLTFTLLFPTTYPIYHDPFSFVLCEKRDAIFPIVLHGLNCKLLRGRILHYDLITNDEVCLELDTNKFLVNDGLVQVGYGQGSGEVGFKTIGMISLDALRMISLDAYV